MGEHKDTFIGVIRRKYKQISGFSAYSPTLRIKDALLAPAPWETIPSSDESHCASRGPKELPVKKFQNLRIRKKLKFKKTSELESSKIKITRNSKLENSKKGQYFKKPPNLKTWKFQKTKTQKLGSSKTQNSRFQNWKMVRRDFLYIYTPPKKYFCGVGEVPSWSVISKTASPRSSVKVQDRGKCYGDNAGQISCRWNYI